MAQSIAGVRAAYSFNEGSGPSIGDQSGSGHTGTITGATWTTAGKFGGGLSFDGINDRITIGSTPLLALTTGTVEAWVRLGTGNRWNGILAKGNTTADAQQNYAVEVNPSNIVSCHIANGTALNLVTSTIPLLVQQFTHVACTWDGSQVRLYINGALNRSITQTLTPAANSSPLYLGQCGGNVDYLDGVLDDVRIYGAALSQGQIQTDMNTPVQ